MKQKYLITGLMVAIFAGGITCLTSCDDDLVINKAIDESAYTGIYENNGYLRDGKSNLSSNVVELYKDTYTTSVKMSLSKMASTSTSAQVIIDADYLDTYNKEHETDFELYPAHLVSFKNDGKLIVDAHSDFCQRAAASAPCIALLCEPVMENSTHSAILVAWSPIRSRYLAIISTSSTRSPSSGFCAISAMRSLLHSSNRRSTTSSYSITLHARVRSRRTNASRLSVTILMVACAMRSMCALCPHTPDRYVTISAISLAWSPIRSISVIIFSTDEIRRRSLATGCCCSSSLRHMDSISRSLRSIS